MICSRTTVSENIFPEYQKTYFDRDSLMLDIETTGLSPAKNFIYCIGCASLCRNEIQICLFFAENADQEKEILTAFCQTVQNFSKIITFNGTTFDLPFLCRRLEYHKMDNPLAEKDSLDLYRESLRLKPLLNLENYRQKSIECFLGIDRDDRYSGKELIAVYQTYTRKQKPDQLDLLLQHNHDDVQGMFGLLSILAYRDFLDGKFRIEHLVKETENQQDFLNIILVPTVPFPQSVCISDKEEKILLDRGRALIRIPICHGILKHYFPDYKNYYYLPAEDTVVHKSVGSYVDAAYRERAVRENCCVKKECSYLHLAVPGPGSYLRRDYADKDIYLDLSLFPNENGGLTLSPEPAKELRQFLCILLKNI